VALREQARPRARRAELSPADAGAVTTALLDRQLQAAQVADSSIASRVAALEPYAICAAAESRARPPSRGFAVLTSRNGARWHHVKPADPGNSQPGTPGWIG
jgi:hypothetical protein